MQSSKYFISGLNNTGCRLVKELVADGLGLPVKHNNTYLMHLVNSYKEGKVNWNGVQDYFEKMEALAGFSRSMIDSYFHHISDYPIICDNNLLLFFVDIKELYPEAKFIALIRDPRDVVALKPQGVEASTILDKYVNFYRLFDTHKEKLGDSLLFLTYEDMVAGDGLSDLELFTGVPLNYELPALKEAPIGEYLYRLSLVEQNFMETHKKDVEHHVNYPVYYDGEVSLKDYKELPLEEATNRVAVLYNNNNTEELLKLTNYYVDKYPEELLFTKILGVVYQEQMEYEKAQKYIDKGLSIDPNDGHLLNSKGLIAFDQNNLDEAQKCFEKCIALWPASADAHNNLARVLKEKKQFAAAKASSKKAMELDPDETFNYTYEDIILSEVTDKDCKVFCIGMNRTGTTSMENALKILEYNVKGEVQKQEDWMLDGNVLKYIKRIAKDYNAFVHEPWCLYYKELYEEYPDSKFILTIRDEQRWVNSFYNYFKTYRDGWTPFLLKSYNLKDLSEREEKEFYLERYREHNKEVLEFFKDKPEQLLVINVPSGDGWEKLCPFLGVEVPSSGFPNSNKGFYKK